MGRLELERQKLVEERDAAIRDKLTEQVRDRMAHEQRMFELRTQRLNAVVEALKHLKELGVTIDAKVRKRVAAMLVESLEANPDASEGG